jgi:hypothetical protein
MELIETRVIEAVRDLYQANLAAGNPERIITFEGVRYKVVGERRLRVVLFEPNGPVESDGSQTAETRKESDQPAQQPPQSRQPIFVQEDLWPEAVETKDILDSVMGKLRQYVVLDPSAYVAVALYVLITYIVEMLPICPLLIISSVVKRSGKTRLLGVLSRVCHFSLPTNNISPAALYRTIEEYKPTLMVDEVDAIFRQRTDQAEALRGLLNAGHDRSSSKIIRCENETHRPILFDAFGPKVLSGIGNIPETLEDRGIVIAMRRKTEKEPVRRFSPLLDEPDFKILRQRLTRWKQDYGPDVAIMPADPVSGLDDRAVDNWTPLLAIADLAGAPWSDLAREAARSLSSDRKYGGDFKIELLRDIKSIFEKDYPREGQLTTETLLQKLRSKEESPWKSYYFQRGEPLDARGLAKMLRLFGIHSFALRQGLQVLRAYKRSDFWDAWDRYLPKEDDQQDGSDVRIRSDSQPAQQSKSDQEVPSPKESGSAAEEGPLPQSGN